MVKNQIILIIFFCFANIVKAQLPIVQLVTPKQDKNMVTNAKQFITGNTTKSNSVTINGNSVKIFATGAFAYPANLILGNNVFEIKVVNDKKSTIKKIEYFYKLPLPIPETDSTSIESIVTDPIGDVSEAVGEYITIKIKAKPNCKLLLNDKYLLKELPKSQTKGIGGYYQTSYKLNWSDTFFDNNWFVSLYKNEQLIKQQKLKSKISIWNKDDLKIGKTTINYTPIYSGLGEDRLGGTKAGFLDAEVLLQIVGEINKLYKVKLANNLTVFVPIDNVEIVNEETVLPKSLSNNITVVGDSVYDYIKINLNKKLPYLTNTNANPNQIVLDIFGATSNSNWIMQYPETLKEINDVALQQIEDGKLRLTISLLHKQLWGYKMYYEGTVLVIQVRRQKEILQLQNLTIAIDAGHGGNNEGAKGITGHYEKEFTLLLAKELQKQLVAEGATIIMTRNQEMSYENQERLKMLRNKMPDFAISLHLNSADDPLRVKGVSTYFKYNALKGLSVAIYKRLLETELKGWGNIGNFNFFLNSATEFPTALVESLFISNPEDEEKIFDPNFRTNFVSKIVLGIKDWLTLIAK